MNGGSNRELGPLPKGWSWQTLHDVLKVRNGFAFKSADYQQQGALLIRQSNLGGNRVSIEKAEYLPEDYLQKYPEFIVRKGDILVGMSGSIGKLCVYDRDEPALQNQRTGLLEFKDENLKRWVWHYLPTVERKLLAGGKGVGVQNISASQIEALPIPVAPREDRDYIVAEIEKQFSRLDEAVANLKRVRANLKRYKAAVLKAAVEAKLTEDWRKAHPDVEPASELLKRILSERRAKWNRKGKYKEPTAPNITELPALPESWTWARLEQLGLIFGGLTKNPKRAKLPKKLPYLRVANVYANELRLEEIEEIGVTEDELDKLLLESGDLLVVEGNGSRDQIGRVAVWDGSIRPCVHQNHIIKVRLVDVTLAKWILVWLLSLHGRGFVEQVASSTSGLYTLSVNKVADLPIVLPPFAEQLQIVDEVERRISLIEKMGASVEADLQRADRLRQSVLHRAFEGKLVKPEGGQLAHDFPVDSFQLRT